MINIEKFSQEKLKLDFYEKLLASTPDLIFHISSDLYNHITINYISNSALEYLNVKDSNIQENLVQIIKQIIIPEDLPNLAISLNRARKSKEQIWNYEFRTYTNNQLRWFAIFAKVEKTLTGYNYSGNLQDITDIKNQEEKLKLSEQRYQFALEASSEGIWDLDVKNNLVYLSSQSMKMLGFEEKDIFISKDFWDDRMHPEDKLKYEQDFEDHINGLKPYYKNLQRIATKDNDYKWILSKGKVIKRDHNNNPSRIIGTHSDISKQREKENTLKQTLEILNEQNQRLNNFAHIVSHNLRSHASNFKMLLDIIETEKDSNLLNECMNHLRNNSNELSDTINNLNDLIEIQSNLKPTKDPLKLRKYLNKVLNLLSEELHKHQVELNIQIPRDTLVDYNPAYLESVLLNFTTNAIKYSSPDRIPTIDYIFEESDGRKILYIKDNGLGIDLKKHGKSLFGMYKTFHKHPNSRGIGLFISKNQIEAMGGKLEVESTVGKGSCFKITFND